MDEAIASRPVGGRASQILSRPAILRLASSCAATLIAGLVVGGLGTRLAMRISAMVADDSRIGMITDNGAVVGEITGEGTVALFLFVGLAAGLSTGLVLFVLRTVLPSRLLPLSVSIVLLAAVVGFVLLYESQMRDSRNAAWETMTSPDGSPLPGARLPFSATAYCKGTTTASGVGVRSGIAAADPSLLPVGTVLNLAVGDPRYNGVYTVMDTGPKVQGRLLDLYMWSCHEALKFGRKDVQVTALRLGWDPRATAPTLIDRIFRGRATRKTPPAEPPPPTGEAPADVDTEDEPSIEDDLTPPEAEAILEPGPTAPSQ